MEKEHLLTILKEVKKAFRDKDVARLKDLSNQTIHSASVEQDDISIAFAVVVYSLAKIAERTNYQEYTGWQSFLTKFLQHIDRSLHSLERNNEKKLRKEVMEIEHLIDKLTGKLRMHIQYVFEKARINKASRIYEHGISMERTAKLLGVTIFELAEYAGRTGISDVDLSRTLPVDKRIKYVLEMFQ